MGKVLGYARISTDIGQDIASQKMKLEELGAVWGADSAKSEADQRSGLFGVEETGGHGEGLAVVVRLDLGKGVEIDDGCSFSGEDLLPLHGIGERVLDDAVIFGLSVDREGFEGFHGLGLPMQTAGEKRDADCESGD